LQGLHNLQLGDTRYEDKVLGWWLTAQGSPPTAPFPAGAHNSHLGDARYTDMGMYRGEVNVGQLLREAEGERHPEAVANIGFITHTGTVAAADEWDSPVKKKRVNPSLSSALPASPTS
jgi:erythromycin esterase-like protein